VTAKQPTTQMRPPGSDWRHIAMDDYFAAAAGPWYWQLRDGVPILGMRVEERHISVRGACHGGVLMTMADLMSLPAGCMAGLIDRLVPTMTLAMDFISPAGASRLATSSFLVVIPPPESVKINSSASIRSK